ERVLGEVALRRRVVEQGALRSRGEVQGSEVVTEACRTCEETEGSLMRSSVLGLAIVLTGCVRSAAERPPAFPATPVVAAVPAGPEVAPMPWEVPSDPDTAVRYRHHQQSEVALLRALARREIRPGDAIEPLIQRFPECDVLRHGPYVNLGFRHG